MDQSDTDFISNQFQEKKPKPMEENFPKYQYLEFVKFGGRDGQVVVRANNQEEFLKLCGELNSFIKGLKNSVAPITPQNDVSVAAETQRQLQSTTQAPTACPQCGGEMWDNREKKRTGQMNIKGPDFACKDKDNCAFIIWPPKS